MDYPPLQQRHRRHRHRIQQQQQQKHRISTFRRQQHHHLFVIIRNEKKRNAKEHKKHAKMLICRQNEILYDISIDGIDGCVPVVKWLVCVTMINGIHIDLVLTMMYYTWNLYCLILFVYWLMSCKKNKCLADCGVHPTVLLVFGGLSWWRPSLAIIWCAYYYYMEHAQPLLSAFFHDHHLIIAACLFKDILS